MPAGLRAYRLLSAAATPLAPLLLAQRLRRGKEDGARLGERRGESGMRRPPGALIWVHGASVGEIAQRVAADRAAARARHPRAGHLGHRDVERSCRTAAAARRHPPIRAARCAALRAPLHRALAAGPGAVRGAGSVAEPDDRGDAPRRAADPGQRPAVGGFVPALAAACPTRSPTCSGASTCAWRARRPTARAFPSSARRASSPAAISSSTCRRRRPTRARSRRCSRRSAAAR